MSHYTTCAIIKISSAEKKEELRVMYDNNPEALFDMLESKLEPVLTGYDTNTKVPLHNVYLDQDRILTMANHYKIHSEDIHALTPYIKDWIGDPGGIDEKGLFYSTTDNPNGHFDNWGIYDAIIASNDIALDLKNKNITAQALLLPNSSWVESEHFFYSVNDDNNEAFSMWENKVADILRNYSHNYIAVLIDCHI